MGITTVLRVWIFAITICVIAIVCTNLANYLMLSPELFRQTVFVGNTIAIVFPLPIALFVGFKLKQLHDLSAQLKKLVNEDRLTSAATREFFFNRIAAMDRVVGVTLMIDIDHFKSINDTHGHFAGDAVLREVSAVLMRAVRPIDMVSRFGGEEFVVFLNDVTEEQGRDIGERLRLAVETAQIVVEAVPIRVTVSVGAASKGSAIGIEEALKAADRALYIAKTAGRNRMVFDA